MAENRFRLVKDCQHQQQRRLRPLTQNKQTNTIISLTFIQPITEPVEDDALLPGGDQSDGATLHCGAIVDVVLKNEDLQEQKPRIKDETETLETFSSVT